MSGTFEWFLDNPNTPYDSNLSIPLLYTQPLGFVSPSYTFVTLANYPWHAPWYSTIYARRGPHQEFVPSAF